MKKTIIKCIDCGFKYYDGDVHECQAVSVEEKTKEKKRTAKTRKGSFKLWQDNQKNDQKEK